MKYKKFENLISETLYNDKVELDVQALIKDIHLKEKKNRHALWFWLAAFCLSAISGFLFLNTKSDKKHFDIQVPTNSISTIEQSSFVSNQIESQNIFTNNSTNHIDRKENKGTPISSLNKPYIENENTNSLLKTGIEQINTINNQSIFQDDPFVIKKPEQAYSLPLLNYESLNSTSTRIIKSDKIICPSFSNYNKITMELIPEIGYFLPMKKLENGYGEENSVFYLRNKNEKTLEGINVGVYIQLRREKLPFYLKTGLSWSSYTERMSLDYSYTYRDTTQGIISITYSQSGDTITTIIGDIIKEYKKSGNKTRHHAFSLWDIPVSLGYEKSFGHWFAGIEGGVIVNLSMHTKGNVLASDTSFINVNVPHNHFKSSVGISYFGGVQIGKDFSKAGRVYLAVRGRYIPDTFSTDTNVIRQKYQFAGINLGYIWTF